MNGIAVIRADAGPGIGGGHVSRCLALAQALVDRAWTINWACRSGTLESVPALAASGLPIIPLEGSQDAEAQAMAAALPAGCDLLIVDHYGRDVVFEDACRTFAGAIGVLDDVPGHRQHRADVLIDGAPGRSAEEWLEATDVERVLSGADYALIGHRIGSRRNASLSRQRTQIEQVLISFGLSDGNNATVPAIRAARKAYPRARIEVVIGPSAPHAGEARREAEACDASVQVAPSDYPDMLVSADLAIGAGGVSALERACLGIPSVVVETAANQRPGIEALAKAQAIHVAGQVDALAKGWPAGVLESIEPRLSDMSRHAAAIVDGRGAVRVAEALDVYATTRETAS